MHEKLMKGKRFGTSCGDAAYFAPCLTTIKSMSLCLLSNQLKCEQANQDEP